MSGFDRVMAALSAKGSRVQTRGDRQASAQCPAHEDRTASLSVSAGEAGALVYCHAGCAIDDVLAALELTRRDLFDNPRDQRAGYVVLAEYAYTDEAGTVLYVKERRYPKDFRQYRPKPDGGKDYRLGDARRVLYRLPEVLATIEQGMPVYITEGEKDADALAARGVCATTWSDGAWKPGSRPKWRDAYTETLAGAAVVIVADRDEAGENTASGIAAALTPVAASVRVVQAKEGKDAADHLEAGHGLADFIPLEVAPAAADEADEGRGPSQATLLRRIALERYDLFVSEDGAPFAVLKDGPRIARPFRGGRSALRAELAKLYADQCGGTVPSASALADALTALEGEASQTDPVPLVTRVAEHDGAIVLDLGRADGQVVRVGPSGWRVLDESPVLLRRTQLTAPMPDPSPDGSLEPLKSRLNINPDDWPLILAWLVAALMAKIPHPLLALIGEHGTAKSTATKLLVQIIDPSAAPLRTMPKDTEQWAVTAAASWVVGLDNISGISPWFSDALCRAVTGDGVVRRRLYADDDVSVLAFRRVIVGNGIDLGSVRGDLADRMLSVELHRIDEGQRRTEQWAEMNDDDRSRVLGKLLDLTAEVLAVLPDIQLDRMPRMADFARVVAAVDKVAGTDALDRFTRQAGDLAGAVVESDAFAAAVLVFAESLQAGGSWTGSAGGLLELLGVPDPKPKHWPADAQRAGAALRRVAPALRSVGVPVDEAGRDGRKRTPLWRIGHPEAQAGELFADYDSHGSHDSKGPVTSGNAASHTQSARLDQAALRLAPGAGASHSEAGASHTSAPWLAPSQAADLHERTESSHASHASHGFQPSSDAMTLCRVCGAPIGEMRTAAGYSTCPDHRAAEGVSA